MDDPTFGEWCIEHESGCRRCGTELSGRRKAWCSNECRDWYYRHHVWTVARHRAMVVAEWKCQRCGSHADEVDHIIERRGMPLGQWSCLHHQANLRPLCHGCHVTRRYWDMPTPLITLSLH
jgi:hypothetical protein